MTSGPIPWSSIQRYAELSPGIDLGIFLLVIREMDDVYLMHQDEAGKKAAKK